MRRPRDTRLKSARLVKRPRGSPTASGLLSPCNALWLHSATPGARDEGSSEPPRPCAPIRRKASCGPARGVRSKPFGRRPSPSGRESHAGAYAPACWVDRSASLSNLQSVPARTRKPAPGSDSLAQRRADGNNVCAALAAHQAAAYAATNCASQSRVLTRGILRLPDLAGSVRDLAVLCRGIRQELPWRSVACCRGFVAARGDAFGDFVDRRRGRSARWRRTRRRSVAAFDGS